jgi:hypothetical protein
MPNVLAPHYVSQFSTNLDLLLQQKKSRFKDAVATGMHKGKQASPVDQIGAISASKVTTQFGAMGRVDAALDRRWVFPVDYDLPQLVDQLDLLRTINDPRSKFVENAVAAMERAMDDEIIAAIFGTAKTGVDGTTSTTFNTSTNRVLSDFGSTGTPSGLTIGKLIEVRKKLMANEVDLDSEQIFMAISAAQHANLLGQTQAINLDYQTHPVMENGKISSILGINFIHSERLPVVNTNERRCAIWVKSGMYLGRWMDRKVSVSQRNDIQSEPYQLYLMETIGSTRLDEKKVFEVLCAE